MTTEPSTTDPLDDAVDRYRRQLGDAPPSVTDAAVAAFGARNPDRVGARQGLLGGWAAARLVVLLAGLAGVALNVAVLVYEPGHAGQDVVALHLAISVGFLLAAWRPERYARGMAPVAAAAAALLFLPSVGGASALAQGALSELAHLPVIGGAAGLLLSRRDAGVREIG